MWAVSVLLRFSRRFPSATRECAVLSPLASACGLCSASAQPALRDREAVFGWVGGPFCFAGAGARMECVCSVVLSFSPTSQQQLCETGRLCSAGSVLHPLSRAQARACIDGAAHTGRAERTRFYMAERTRCANQPNSLASVGAPPTVAESNLFYSIRLNSTWQRRRQPTWLARARLPRWCWCSPQCGRE